MLRAILFDFNGVIVDDEPLHFSLFQKALAPKNLSLTKEDYYQKYLGFDDRDAFAAALKDRGVDPSAALIHELTETKAAAYDQEAQKLDLFVPGALDFIRKSADKYFLGVVSGALRREVEAWLKRGGVLGLFQAVVAAEDMKKGKPDPEGFLRALDRINRDFVPSSEILLPQECLTIEDSMWGIQAAHGADMKCLALTTSYSKAELQKADWVVGRFSEISLEKILEAFV